MTFKNLNLGLLIFRVTFGALMLFHGIAKIQKGIDGIANMLAEKGIPEFIAYGVYMGEVVAPILLIIGFKTRISALILLINMLVIVFIAHPEDIFALNDHGAWKLELAGMYLFGSLALFFTGGGKYAISSSSALD